MFDQGTARYSVFTPHFEHVRSVVLPAGNAWSFVALAPGTFIVNAQYPTRERSGFPLHHLTCDGLGRSFGATESGRGFIRRLAAETDSTFWAIHGAEYRIDLWHTDGRLLRSFERSPTWFVRAPPTTIEGRLNPLVVDAQIDGSGRLWLLVVVRDRQWRERAELGIEGAPGIRSDRPAGRRTVIRARAVPRTVP